MPRSLPLRADLTWLKKYSKDRLAEMRAVDLRTKLSEAQLATAREFGFSSWRALKAHVEKTRAQLDELVPPSLRLRAAKENVEDDDPELHAFFAAIERGEVKFVAERLEERPALVRARGAAGQTPLHAAAERDDARLAALLAAYGADLNAHYGESGHTPLSWAVTVGAFDCARALLRLGGEADLFCAAGIGSLDDMRDCFTANGDLRPRAMKTGSSSFAPDGERLACPPDTDRERISDALYIASRNGHANVIAFLLEKNPDLSFRAYLGATALHWAYFSGSRAAIELLLAAGADPAACDDSLGCTPRSFGVCLSANWGFAPILRGLLDGDPALVDVMDGVTSPLHEAAKHGRAECVAILLSRGANRSLENGDGKTPIQLAKKHGHEAIAAALQKTH